MSDYLQLVKPWNVGPPRELLRTRMFTIFSRHAASAIRPDRAGDFVEVRCPEWCNVIALTPDRKVIMIEQYRHGLAQVTLEVPGGIVDSGEDPAHACSRELLEETGYGGPGNCQIIGRVSANPALQNNWVHTGLIRGVVPQAGTHLDEHEEIAIRLIPLDDIGPLIRRGIIHHAFVVTAFMHLTLAAV